MNLKISDFTLLDIGILESNFKIHPNELIKLVQFIHQVDVAHVINIEKNILFIQIGINLINEDTNKIVANFKTSIAFGFGHLNLSFDTADSKFPFSQKLTHQLTDSAISTTRGIMFMYLKGSIFHKAYLPLMDFSEVKIPVKK